MLSDSEIQARIREILTTKREPLSALAREGCVEHGRGAIIFWEPNGPSGLRSYEAKYIPLTAPWFQDCGPMPLRMTQGYDPEQHFVAVFVTAGDDKVHCIVEPLAPLATLH